MAEIRRKGMPYRAETFNSKLEAQAWAFEVERSHGKHHTTSGHTFGDALIRYATEISPTKKGARWEKIRLIKIGRDPIRDILLKNITTDDIQAWINRQPTSAGSINRELNLISSVLEISRKRWKWHTCEPMKDIERPKNPPARDRRISESEIAAILEALGYDENAPIRLACHEAAIAFLLALETAMRQGEIFGLRWEHINLERKFLHLPDTKNGSKRDVPLSKEAVRLLERLDPRGNGRVFGCSQAVCATEFRDAVKHKAGIANLVFHDTRHEALTRLAQKIPVMDLARMVGHKDLRSLMIYYNATASEIASRLD